MNRSPFFASLALAAGQLAAAPDRVAADDVPTGAIAFASLAPRGWDVYLADVKTRESRRLTDAPSLDFNAAFHPEGDRLAFVSERGGHADLYVMTADGSEVRRLTDAFALNDRPAWAPHGRQLAFSSTREPADRPGRAWNAIYVMDLAAPEADGGPVRRISPPDAADYSPAWSPSGDWIACASGDGEEGKTDLYAMRPDGSDRHSITKNGGWPAFAADGRSVYFHSKRGEHWGIWKVSIEGDSEPERITPDDIDAFTPSLSADGRRLAFARKGKDGRRIVVMDLDSGSIEPITPEGVDAWNPALAPDGRSVAYHRTTPGTPSPNIERWGAPSGTRLAMLRLEGAFPAFSPDGRRLALTGGSFGQLDVMGRDGSGRTTLYRGERRAVFSTSWAHSGDRIAFAHGPVFEGPKGAVEVASVRPDGSDLTDLTHDPANDGFPAFSPDGRQLVFRSGRGGNKNLFLMDADGSNVRPLTEGRWTDTMCDWSPTGEWIAFASDRDGDFEVWLIHPDGTGLRKLVAGGGRNNHPHFSPDGRWIVFTSKRAGHSAEEVSLPSQPQPYGDLFAIRLDGSGLVRLTHNGFEEGTPAWGPALDDPAEQGSPDSK